MVRVLEQRCINCVRVRRNTVSIDLLTVAGVAAISASARSRSSAL
jgi:hypothetical protein